MQIYQATADGIITAREQSLILNSLTIGKRTAREILVPRVQVAYLDITRTMEANRKVVDAHLYSRLPLCDGDMDHVLGVVRVKDFLTAYHAQGDTSVLHLLAQPPTFIPQTIPLDRLLAMMQEAQARLVFLVDEYGGVAGVVTMRDVVDELLGQQAVEGRA
jgi:putative hemolysin